jgi:TetR/AcrR family transcriptional repressor of nem operon
MGLKSDQKEQTHRAILESASKVFRKRGIGGASVADVMAGARLTVGGFYAHFDSKAALVDETLRQMGQRLRATLFDRIDEKPAADRAIVVLKRYLSAPHRDLKTEGCPFPAVVGEIGTTAPEHRDALKGEVEALIAGLTQQLPAPTPYSALAALPRRHVAIALIAMMYGGMSLARALRGLELSDEVIKACQAVGSWVVSPGKEKS